MGDVTICANCGADIPTAESFCPRCGEPKIGLAVVAVAAGLVGTDKLPASAPAEDVATITERFYDTAQRVASFFGGREIRAEGPTVYIIFAGEEEKTARAGANAAFALRRVAKENLAEFKSAFVSALDVRVGVAGPVTARPGRSAAAEATTAARRLSVKAAGWAILVDENINRYAREEFQFAPVGFYQYHGGSAAIKIYQLKESRPRTAYAQPAAVYLPPAGLENEFRRILDAALAESKIKTFLLTGAPGSGKTAALRYLAAKAAAKGFRVYATAGRRRERFTPFGIWLDILREILIPSQGSGEDALKDKLLPFGEEIWVPVLARVLGIPTRGNEFVPDFPRTLLWKRVGEIIASLISQVVGDGPSVIIVDDVHYADAGSMSVIKELTTRLGDRPIVLAAATDQENQMITATDFERLPMPALTAEEVSKLVATLSGTAGEDAEVYFKLSQGNPAAVIQLLQIATETPVTMAMLREEGRPLSLAALIDHHLRDLPARWRRGFAALVMTGIPVSKAEVVSLLRPFWEGKQDETERFLNALAAMGFLESKPAPVEDSWQIPGCVEASLENYEAFDQTERNEAMRAAENFFAAYRPSEKLYQLQLFNETGNHNGAAGVALAEYNRFLEIGAAEIFIAVATAVLYPRRGITTPEAKNGKWRALLYGRRAYASFHAGLWAAALADADEAGEQGFAEGNAEKIIFQVETLAAAGFYEKAEETFAHNLDRIQSPELLGRGYYALARALSDAGKLQLASDKIDAALRHLKRASPGALKLEIEILHRTGRLREAAAVARELTEEHKHASRPYAAADAALIIGPLLFHEGKVLAAKHVLDEARRVFERVRDYERRCETLSTSAAIALLTDDVIITSLIADEALKEARRLDLPRNVVSACLTGAKAALLAGDTERAQILAAEGQMAAAGFMPFPSAAFKSYEAFGSFYGKESYREAAFLAAAAAEEYVAAGDLVAAADATALGAYAAICEGDVATCQHLLTTSPLNALAKESPVFFAKYGKVIGNCLAQMGDAERARHYLRAAAAAARETQLWLDAAECHLALARLEKTATARESHNQRARWLLETHGAVVPAPIAKNVR